VPQVLVNATLPQRKPLSDMPKASKATADAEKKLGRDGRVLVRWSGTEPKLRVMIEGPKEDLIKRMANEIAEAAKQDLA
jgi:phosphoglucosamine mutase